MNKFIKEKVKENNNEKIKKITNIKFTNNKKILNTQSSQNYLENHKTLKNDTDRKNNTMIMKAGNNRNYYSPSPALKQNKIFGN